MGVGVLMRLFVGTVLGLVLAFAVSGHNERERSEEDAPEQPRYRPYLPNVLLPYYMAAIAVAGILLRERQVAFELLLSMFSIFLDLSVYYLLLSLLMPVLRRYISARVCAALWLIPNYLYLLTQEAYELPNPALVLYLPNGAISVLAVIWAVGVTGVLGWKVLSHFRFRRQILRDAREVCAPDILELWCAEQRRAGIRHDGYRLVRSPAVSTPLTIGFFRRSIRVVLPERSYTPEELRFIFRHELVHIGREDAGTKFFLVFCTAMCWFNPLMWWAQRRSAEDLELSCDETVLLNEGEAARRQYAELILTTAGDERGFTTCLSASAKALRYRLQGIIRPRKRWPGFLTAGLAFFLLVATCGYTALAYETVPGSEAVFGGNDRGGYTITKCYWRTGDEFVYYEVKDPDALTEYLAGLDFYKTTGNYSFDSGERCLGVYYQSPEGRTRFDLTDKGMDIHRPEEGRLRQYRYSCGDVDWDYVASLINLE